MKRFPDESPADYKLRRLKDKVETQQKLKGKMVHLSIDIFPELRDGKKVMMKRTHTYVRPKQTTGKVT